ncbi:MAG: lipoyl synthase [Candidatus Woesearchaeota archaeon]
MKKNKKRLFPKIKNYNKKAYLKTKKLIESFELNTICFEANCPNRYECLSKKTATFLILGDVCTRNCLYCNVKKGVPKKIDLGEPRRIALAIKRLRIEHAVITSVTRDDLKDSGAGQFARTVREIRSINPNCRIELLIPDLRGNWNALKEVLNSNPDVVNHNIEVVQELFKILRPKGNYDLSLKLLKKIKELNPKITTKSGFMLGFGENKKQIFKTIIDLYNAECDILTVGQYLQPSKKHFSVKRYYSKKEFEEIKRFAEKVGFKKVFSGFFVRSSYMAGEMYG